MYSPPKSVLNSRPSGGSGISDTVPPRTVARQTPPVVEVHCGVAGAGQHVVRVHSVPRAAVDVVAVCAQEEVDLRREAEEVVARLEERLLPRVDDDREDAQLLVARNCTRRLEF